VIIRRAARASRGRTKATLSCKTTLACLTAASGRRD